MWLPIQHRATHCAQPTSRRFLWSGSGAPHLCALACHVCVLEPLPQRQPAAQANERKLQALHTKDLQPQKLYSPLINQESYFDPRAKAPWIDI